jgi:hypothetical protein
MRGKITIGVPASGKNIIVPKNTGEIRYMVTGQ